MDLTITTSRTVLVLYSANAIGWQNWYNLDADADADADLFDLDDLIFQNDALMYEFPGAQPIVPRRRSSLFVAPVSTINNNGNGNDNQGVGALSCDFPGALPRRRSSLIPPNINTVMANAASPPSATRTTLLTPTSAFTPRHKLTHAVALMDVGSKNSPPRRSSSLPPTPQEPDSAVYSRLFGQEYPQQYQSQHQQQQQSIPPSPPDHHSLEYTPIQL
ncbi:hypothetical protein BDF22DRAFT_745189 [Syncephalis plumigaleata]|nr:hypothetical protein BDF22DRAFT_745189 [Syncephalis plumigaleata]